MSQKVEKAKNPAVDRLRLQATSPTKERFTPSA